MKIFITVDLKKNIRHDLGHDDCLLMQYAPELTTKDDKWSNESVINKTINIDIL